MSISIENPLHQKALLLARSYQNLEFQLLEVLREIEFEKLHLRLGYSSLFVYATGALKLSEAVSFNLINVMRKAKEVPQLRAEIERGALSVSTARKIVPVLTKENYKAWIEDAKRLPKIELEKRVAEAQPEMTKRTEITRSSPTRQRLHLDLSDKVLEKLKRAQILLRSSKRENLDLAQTLDQVLEVFLNAKDPIRKAEKTTVSSKAQSVLRTASGLRRIPSPIRHAIFKRDEGKCQFRGGSGNICYSDQNLQIRHFRPWAMGGDHNLDNLGLRCWAHHQVIHENG